MKLAKMSKEELELYSYVDLSKIILSEEGKPMNTPNLFHKICDLLGLTEDDYADKIGDYYTSLTTDKDFVLLDDGNWDLRDHHPVKVVLDEEEIEDESLEEEIEEEEIIEEENIDEISEDDLDDDDDEDDTADLTILEDEELDD